MEVGGEKSGEGEVEVVGVAPTVRPEKKGPGESPMASEKKEGEETPRSVEKPPRKRPLSAQQLKKREERVGL